MSPPAITWVVPSLVKVAEGRVVNLSVATLVPAGVTFEAVSTNANGVVGLPNGLSFDGALGAFWGQLAQGAGGTDRLTDGSSYLGSEGIYTITVNAYDESHTFLESTTFTADVSRWRTGDVFAGVGLWTYSVFSETGEFKYDVHLPHDALGDQQGSTPGCSVNWKTREIWATNYDSITPGVQVITRQSDSGTEVGGAPNALPYTSPSRRVSTVQSITYRDENGNLVQGRLPYFDIDGNIVKDVDGHDVTYVTPLSTHPESIAFDNDENMFVGHSFGFLNNDFNIAGLDGKPMMLYDPFDPTMDDQVAHGLVYVDAAGAPMHVYRPARGAMRPISYETWISPDGYFEEWSDAGARAYLYDRVDTDPLRQRVLAPLQAGMDIPKSSPPNGV